MLLRRAPAFVRESTRVWSEASSCTCGARVLGRLVVGMSLAKLELVTLLARLARDMPHLLTGRYPTTYIVAIIRRHAICNWGRSST